ncbi:HD domain-containing phosphohydrolase [Motiliproteus sp. MSK22-1]|uniref:HD domain-containing phosphohydrolase n=1 Tax=Motiliproteus sp. MSK22-1 TaxID=1897630 RepID=UPI000975759E|nr:HD domain-containing phosphohydrolase [Motiliproteus sp. MSK22-1]OMH25896.1 hypothetical protein BGP75_25635 [Motiliproteus sp. MSK22-1]
MTEQISQIAENQGVGVLTQEADLPRESLLFVDDERNILSSLRRLFRPLNYTVHLASSGREGLEILKQHPIDLIVSDMRMPEMDGAEFLAEAAKLYPESVRILLTGFSDLTSTIDAINEGKIYRYLSKPWEDTEITLAVDQALKTKRLEREKRQLLELTERQNKELKDLNENLEAKVLARTEELQQTADMLDLAYKELNESYQHTIRVFSSLISMREHLSSRHAQKVAELARTIAKSKKLDSDTVRDVYFAGLLHELGKLSLPDYLLDRPVFSLNRGGREKYQRHPIKGQTALMAVEALQPAGNLIRAHEEYYDGSGFPDHLRGEDIPLGARILSIAKDFYGYQNGKLLTNTLSSKNALERIQQHSGKQYDPSLVAILTALVNKRLEDTPQQKELRVISEQLVPGMTLSRDIYSRNDMLLLTKGRVLSEILIRKLIQLEEHEQQSYDFYVYEGMPK